MNWRPGNVGVQSPLLPTADLCRTDQHGVVPKSAVKGTALSSLVSINLTYADNSSRVPRIFDDTGTLFRGAPYSYRRCTMAEDKSLKPEDFPVHVQQRNIVKNDGKPIAEACDQNCLLYTSDA